VGKNNGLSGLSAIFGGRRRSPDPNAADREAALAQRRERSGKDAGSAGDTEVTEVIEVIELTAVHVERAHGVALITLKAADGSPSPVTSPAATPTSSSVPRMAASLCGSILCSHAPASAPRMAGGDAVYGIE